MLMPVVRLDAERDLRQSTRHAHEKGAFVFNGLNLSMNAAKDLVMNPT